MRKLQLSHDFNLSEFQRSDTALRMGIKNEANSEQVRALKNLCINVLQPLRNFYGKPITVSSGFRCEQLNRAVGGVFNSQHLRGEAADIPVPSATVAMQWIKFIRRHCHYDQILLEHRKATGARWIHVSCKTDDTKNRHSFRTIEI